MKKQLSLLFVLMLALAACGGDSNNDENTTATPVEDVREDLGGSGQRVEPLALPTRDPDQAWIAANEPILADNVFRVANLGRIDPDGTTTVFAHSFSADGTQLALLNNDFLLGYDLITGESIFTNTRQETTSLYFSPDKESFFALTASGEGLVFDVERGQRRYTFQAHPAFSRTTAYHAASGLLAVGGTDGTIKVWDMIERVSLVTIDAHEGGVGQMRFNADGTRLASAGADQQVIVWDWQNREALITVDNGSPVTNLALNPVGDLVVMSGIDFAMVWQVEEGTFLYTLQLGEGGASEVLAFSPDGRYLVTGGTALDTVIWVAETGAVALMLEGVGGQRMSAAFSPDGQLLIVSVLGQPVNLYNLAALTEETVQQAALDVGSQNIVNVSFSPDGYVLLFFDAAGIVYAWGIAPET